MISLRTISAQPANQDRLPSLAPYHASLLGAHCPTSHPLEHTHGEPDTHLASNANPD